ncbi:MAG: peptidoglycan DD-metalloendopeptidase family protein [Bacilli bacterium]
MNKIIIYIFLLILCILSITTLFWFKSNDEPMSLYKVYIDNNYIGNIKSEKKLYNYINKMNELIKKEYNVSNVYSPNNVSVEPYLSYDKNILSEQKVYEIISETSPFTIDGYELQIKTGKDKYKKIYVVDYDMYMNVVETVIKTFVGEEKYDNYKNNIDVEITGTGSKIDYLTLSYIADFTVRQGKISIDNKIFTDKSELLKYMMYSTLEDTKIYTVKKGDTITSIASNNLLNTDEFLIANPKFTNKNNLLFIGEKVNVSLVNPIFTILHKEYNIDDISVPFETEIKYDSNMKKGKTKVTQEGKNGLSRQTRILSYENGQILPEVKLLSSEELNAPTKKIVIEGTKVSSGSTGGTIVIGDSSNWVWPASTKNIITSRFGRRWGKMHNGTDFSGAGHGSPIYAVTGGNVEVVGYGHRSNGNYIIINHNNGVSTAYLHLSSILVNKGQSVTRGQKIGGMGNTGRSTGTHLHFEIRKGKSSSFWLRSAINPCRVLGC